MSSGFKFAKASKAQAKARVALMGVTGSGKTYTALKIATDMGGAVALIDTEHGTASKYADQFSFDTLSLTSYEPDTYVAAIKAAVGYDVLVIDSLSHAWAGKNGALEQVDQIAKRSNSGNKFQAWGDVTPMQQRLVEAMLSFPGHLIITMRSKMEYVLEENERGKKVPRKIGLAPVQRDGIEYEFDVVGDLNLMHELIVTKTRCPALDGAIVLKGDGIGATLKAWLEDGEAPTQPAPPQTLIPFTPPEIAAEIKNAASLDTLKVLFTNSVARARAEGWEGDLVLLKDARKAELTPTTTPTPAT
jgi:hypothetical protein